MRFPHTVVALAVAVAAAAAAAPRAGADLDVPLLNGNKVAGSFVPASETEVFRAFFPAGAKVTSAVAGKRVRGAPAPVVRMGLFDPDDAPAGQTSIKTTATGAKLAGFAAAISGLHSFRLASGQAGDYSFTLKWKSPAGTRKTPLAFAGSGDESVHPIAADSGAVLTLAVAAAKGSASKPRIVYVESADGEWASDPFDPPANESAASHKVTGVRLGGVGGDYVVHVEEWGDTGGEAVLSVTIKPPRIQPRKVDVSTKQTGTDELNQFGKGVVIGPDGGDLDLGAESGSPIDGASLSVPPGSLGKPVVIIIGTAAPIRPPGGGQAKGPGVSFGPDGLQFKAGADGQRVFATIPFDPTDFDGDFSSLDVYVEDAQGKVTLVTPKSDYEIDPVARTVSFPVAHFSSYQVFGPVRKRPRDLNGDGFDDLVVPAPSADGATGRVHVFFGGTKFRPTSVGDADVVLLGPAPEAGFGRSVAVGDVNGDGFADLVVGTPGAPDGGRVDVFRGGTTFSAATLPLTFTPDATSGEFGLSVLVADLDGDGMGDLAVADPSYSGQGGVSEGAVFVFPGGPSIASATTAAAGVVAITGGLQDHRFGVALAAGHLTGGTTPDLVVSAGEGPAGLSSGTVHVIAGGGALASGVSFDLGVEYSGDSSDDQFGASVAAGDVNGDGIDDLIAGAPGATTYREDGETTVPASGSVFVFFGPDLDGGGAAIADLETHVFTATGEQRGRAIVLGNFIGDSLPDLAVGMPGHDEQDRLGTGRISLQRGGALLASGFQLSDGRASDDQYGARFMIPADLNGDGRDELAVSAPGANGGAGQVLVFFGPGLFGPRLATIAGASGDALGGP